MHFFVKFFEILTTFSSRSAIEAHRLMLGIIKALNASALPTNYKFEGTPKRTTFAADFLFRIKNTQTITTKKCKL